MSEEKTEEQNDKLPGKKFFPGVVNMANERGMYSGCRCVRFEKSRRDGPVDKQIEDYFSKNRQNLVTDIKYNGDSALVFYTSVLTEEEKAEFDEITRETEALLSVRREKRAAERRAYEQEQLKAQKEKDRLVEVGKKCESNHGHLIKQLREEAKKPAEMPPAEAPLLPELPEEGTA